MEPQDDDGVTVEVEGEHPDTLEQKEAELVSAVGSEAVSFLHTYGWYILVLAVAGLYIWNKWLKEKYNDWRIEREEREYDARYHKNPDIGVGRARQEAMEAARKKQQEKLNQATALYAEIEQEREEKRRLQKLGELPKVDGGRRLGNSLDDDAMEESIKNSLIAKKARATRGPDYNPLDGTGGSGGYRPQARNCPGGGCGKR